MRQKRCKIRCELCVNKITDFGDPVYMIDYNKFYKVTQAQFQAAYDERYAFSKSEILQIYKDLKLPAQATSASAGHDFFAPFDFKLAPRQGITVPTGIRCRLLSGRFLAVFPRSGLGFKFRLQLDNTVGIIDEDYFNGDNEGHIFIKLTNDSAENKTVEVKKGQAFAQGIIMRYEIAQGAEASNQRRGGIGSTDTFI